MSNLVETGQAIDLLGDLAAQAFKSFADGVQFQDLFDFTDEATSIPNAVNGLADNFRGEALAASPDEVDAKFAEQRNKLIEAGIPAITAATAETGLKTIYYAFAAAVQNQTDES
jgi:hypothetical protein